MRDFLIRIKLRRDLLVVGSKVISTTLLSFVLLNSTFGQTGVGGGLSSGRLLDQGLHEVGINLYCDDLEAETRSWTLGLAARSKGRPNCKWTCNCRSNLGFHDRRLR